MLNKFIQFLKRKLSLGIILVLSLVLMVKAQSAEAQTKPIAEPQQNEETQLYQGQVLSVVETGQGQVLGQTVEYQLLEIELTPTKSSQIKEKKQKIVQIKHNLQEESSLIEYQPGDKVWVRRLPKIDLPIDNPENQLELPQYVITGPDRSSALIIISLIFLVAVVAVSRFKGLRAILSLLISFAVIFQIMLPLLMRGWQPVTVSLLTAVIIIPVSFYLSHGWNKKTHVAVGGTTLALLLSIFLAVTFVNNAHLTGFASEEAGLLNVEQQGSLNIQGLLLAGLIIGLLGTLDDITISQSAFVFQMNQDDPNLSMKKLYQKAMKIGQDHIASMVNTLVLVYAGSALPLLLLFVNNPQPIAYILNQEIVAEEIIRTLMGSIGLIFAAPLTTFLATAVAKRKSLNNLIK